MVGEFSKGRCAIVGTLPRLQPLPPPCCASGTFLVPLDSCIHKWSCGYLGFWHLVAFQFGQLMLFRLQAVTPRILSDHRAERTHIFVIVSFDWYQGHNLHIWAFLQPADHLNTALTHVAAFLDVADNIEDITNDPYVSDEEPTMLDPTDDPSFADPPLTELPFAHFVEKGWGSSRPHGSVGMASLLWR